MGFMDKLKAEAEQAVALAQHGVDTAQAKVESMQVAHAGDLLLQALGLAYYRAQHGQAGDGELAAALAAVDAHVAQNGPLPSPVPPAPAPAAPAPAQAAPTFAPPAGAPVPSPTPTSPAAPPAATEFHVDDL